LERGLWLLVFVLKVLRTRRLSLNLLLKMLLMVNMLLLLRLMVLLMVLLLLLLVVELLLLLLLVDGLIHVYRVLLQPPLYKGLQFGDELCHGHIESALGRGALRHVARARDKSIKGRRVR
jgi:hypothetical protein